MLNYILFSTIEEADKLNLKIKITTHELRTFIGLIYIGGALSFNRTNLDILGSKKFGLSVFKETMSRDKFKQIRRVLRFERNKIRWCEKEDEFCPIRYIFEQFTCNCMICYQPERKLTIDERLLPLKNRCSLIQFIPSKPDKYGIKLWLLVDATTKYVYNQRPYLGRYEKVERGEQTVGEFAVTKLAEPIFGYGYTLTMDNFFTTLKLAHSLLSQKATIVGTIRGNSRILTKEHKKIKKVNESELFQEKSKGVCLRAEKKTLSG